MRREFILSKCGKHRFKLKYTWDDNKPALMFIMLNPSYMRGEDEQLSPTSRIIIDYAKVNGYGSVWVGNLFSYISANPFQLLNTNEQILLMENDICLRQMSLESHLIIFAWGKYEFAKRRGEEIRRMFPKGVTIFTNKDGTPAHPLSINFKYKPVI